MLDALKKFCPRLENYISIHQDGTYDICCERDVRHSSKLTPSQHSFSEFFESEYVSNLNKTMATGKFPDGCEACSLSELENRPSLRQHLLSIPTEPKILHIHVGNHCNSDCVMCGPVNSSTIANRLRKHPDTNLNYFQPQLQNIRSIWKDSSVMDRIVDAAKFVDKIMFVGGEPMLYNELWKLLDNPDLRTKSIHIVTNGSVSLSDAQIEILSKFDSLTIAHSIDATHETYEWIRQGLSWKRLLRNLTIIKNIKNCSIPILCVVQAHNISNLPDHLEFFSKLNLETNYADLIEPILLRPSNAPKGAIERSLARIQSLRIDDRNLIQMLESFLISKPSREFAELASHTEYLNRHRTHKFDINEWKVINKVDRQENRA